MNLAQREKRKADKSVGRNIAERDRLNSAQLGRAKGVWSTDSINFSLNEVIDPIARRIEMAVESD
ncbi:MAG: hypothetical protein LBI39_00090 [Puniceicoccales bacterium]|nr:hypothetical protein [Puniceicoccales bacterium]